MDEDQLLAELTTLRVATVGGQRAIHKPLLVLWLLKNFIDRNVRGAKYSEAEAPVGKLIRKYAPGATTAADLAATPFVHLERSLWQLSEVDGTPIPPTPTRSGSWLKARGARGELGKEFVDLIDTPHTLYAAVDALLEEYFDADVARQVQQELNLNLRVSTLSSPLRRSAPASARQVPSSRTAWAGCA